MLRPAGRNPFAFATENCVPWFSIRAAFSNSCELSTRPVQSANLTIPVVDEQQSANHQKRPHRHGAESRASDPGTRRCTAKVEAAALPLSRIGSASSSDPRRYASGYGEVGALLRREAGCTTSLLTNWRARQLPMRYETGLPSCRSMRGRRTGHASTASRRCPDERRARRPSPTIDVYRKTAFSTRAC